MKQLPERLESFLGVLDGMDRADRMQMLVDVAGGFQCVPATIAERPYSLEHRVPGCESEVYVWAQPAENSTLQYYFAVENPQGISAMALATILADSLNGSPVEEVSEISADIIYRIFGRELSMGKSLGLMGMVNMVKANARQHIKRRTDAVQNVS